MQLEVKESGLVLLRPKWDIPEHVQSFVSTRSGGVSAGLYTSLNLGTNVGDQPENVKQNREKIRAHLPNEPIWLNQVHGTDISTDKVPIEQADGIVTERSNRVLSIMTADCLPLLFCDHTGDLLAACHGGWRGLSQGIVAKTVQQMLLEKRPDDTKKYLAGISVYLGPCIGPQHFEVGIDVVEAFHHHGELLIKDAFKSSLSHEKCHANLFKIATIQCQLLGIEKIFTEEICCFEEKDVFFSHRRDRQTGRFASFLWKI